MKRLYLYSEKALRGVALFAVASILLASARSIVPEICATQEAIASCHQEVAVAPANNCCDEPARADVLDVGDVGGQLIGGAVHCGLCLLATAVVLPLEEAVTVRAQKVARVTATTLVQSPALQTQWPSDSPRAPPGVLL